MLGWDRKRAAKKAALKNTSKRSDYYAHIARFKSLKKDVDRDYMNDSWNEYAVKVEGDTTNEWTKTLSTVREARTYKRLVKKATGKKVHITQRVYDSGFIAKTRRVY